jgi:hypothetical protein
MPLLNPRLSGQDFFELDGVMQIKTAIALTSLWHSQHPSDTPQ